MESVISLSTLQQQLKDGSVLCSHLVDDYLSKINQHEHLNAFLEVYADEARTRAADIDQRIASGSAGRLAGLIVGLKDTFAHAGHPVSAASKILTGYRSPYSATAVQRLLDEDAIIIGRQNCDEFAMGSSNENSAFGPVQNPHDPSRVPGGSSGGSAAAVAAGLCQLAIGSDTGGSVRQPAAFCGVFGLKPTYGRISRYGLLAYGSSFDCVGLLGTNLEDLAMVLNILAGPDQYDSTASTRPADDYAGHLVAPATKKYRVAYPTDALTSEGIQPEIREALHARLEALKKAGHTVHPITLPYQDYVLPTYYILATAEASSNLARYDGVRYGHRTESAGNLKEMYEKSRAEGFGREVQRRILLGTYVLSAQYYDSYYQQAQKVRALVRQGTKKIFDEYDYLLMPVTPTTAFPLGQHASDPVQMYLADLYSVQANVAGVPALALPCGRDKRGLPIGLQVLGNDFDESGLFQFSKVLLNLGP
ncbi:MAG: Asp-tRNA(Asn)/Glu-tRNA(Gln) amidotransferase subunit GatA [Cyclobacteriaceae bacterium]